MDGRKSTRPRVSEVGGGTPPRLGRGSGSRQLPRGDHPLAASLAQGSSSQRHTAASGARSRSCSSSGSCGCRTCRRWAVAAVAVLEHAGVPGQACELVVWQTQGLPHPHLPASRQNTCSQALGEPPGTGAIHTWERRRGQGAGASPHRPLGHPSTPQAMLSPFVYR